MNIFAGYKIIVRSFLQEKTMAKYCVKTPRNTHNRLSFLPVAALILSVVMLGSCKKSSSDQPGPDGTTPALRFVFLADSRGDSLDAPIDTTALNPIIRQIGTLSPAPSFIIFGGDMAYRGCIHGTYTFNAFKNLFSSLTSKGIKLYTTVGNHELHDETCNFGFLLANQQRFQADFAENPSNGPAGYEKLAYSFTNDSVSAFFAVLDPYFLNTDTVYPTNLGGHIDPVQMNWLKSQVAQTTARHKFLFIHTPYYYVYNDSAEFSSADTSLTSLWSYLDAQNFDFYACGHSHLYSRRTINNTVAPDPQTTPPTPAWHNNVVQLLCGTCGAGPDNDYISPAVKTEWDVHNDPLTYYFTVIDVSGNTATVNSYKGFTGTYTVFETFTITR